MHKTPEEKKEREKKKMNYLGIRLKGPVVGRHTAVGGGAGTISCIELAVALFLTTSLPSRGK